MREREESIIFTLCEACLIWRLNMFYCCWFVRRIGTDTRALEMDSERVDLRERSAWY